MNILVVFLILEEIFQVSMALTGHVCTRQRAEQYLTTYDRAFICPERYTTSCGHLDWRRCTKYRAQTCHTPTERYATRYVTVEECCPGWKDAGAGDCSLPVCDQDCRNGGSCVVRDEMPGCECPDGFYGNHCEQKNTGLKSGTVVMIVFGCLTCIALVTITTVLLKHLCFSSASKAMYVPLKTSDRDNINEIEMKSRKESLKVAAETGALASSSETEQTDITSPRAEAKVPSAPEQE